MRRRGRQLFFRREPSHIFLSKASGAAQAEIFTILCTSSCPFVIPFDYPELRLGHAQHTRSHQQHLFFLRSLKRQTRGPTTTLPQRRRQRLTTAGQRPHGTTGVENSRLNHNTTLKREEGHRSTQCTLNSAGTMENTQKRGCTTEQKSEEPVKDTPTSLTHSYHTTQGAQCANHKITLQTAHRNSPHCYPTS